MKSNKLLWINGIVGILGGLQIIYASLNRWHWEIIYSVPTLVENAGWGDMVVLTSWLLLGLSIVGMYHYSNDPRVNKTSHELHFFSVYFLRPSVYHLRNSISSRFVKI
jgi:insulin activator factor